MRMGPVAIGGAKNRGRGAGGEVWGTQNGTRAEIFKKGSTHPAERPSRTAALVRAAGISVERGRAHNLRVYNPVQIKIA